MFSRALAQCGNFANPRSRDCSLIAGFGLTGAALRRKAALRAST